MASSRSRRPSASLRFCQALLEETGGEVLRWATIAEVAKRLGMDECEAILLAGECAEADYVRLDVKGPPYRILPGSTILTEAGRLSKSVQRVERRPECQRSLQRRRKSYRSI